MGETSQPVLSSSKNVFVEPTRNPSAEDLVHTARSFHIAAMGRGGDGDLDLAALSESEMMGWSLPDGDNAASALVAPKSIQLNYPKSRILLGTMTNMQRENRGVHKALDIQYPLELSFDCSNLPHRQRRLSRRTVSDLRPFAIIYFRSPHGGAWEMIGRTETVFHDEYTRFVTKLKLSCATTEDRLKGIRVVVYDRRTTSEGLRDQRLIGSVECHLDDVVTQPLLTRTLPIKNAEAGRYSPQGLGAVILSADVVRPVARDVLVRFSMEVASQAKGSKQMFFVLSRQIRSGAYTAIYRSEVMKPSTNRFASVSRTLGAITAGVESKLLHVELYQFDPRGSTHVKLGFMQTTIAKLRADSMTSRQLWWPSAISEGDDVVEVGRVMMTDRDLSEDMLSFRFRFTQ